MYRQFVCVCVYIYFFHFIILNIEKLKLFPEKRRRYFENKSSCVHERLLEKLRYSVFTYFLPLPHTPWPSLLDWLLYSMYSRIFWIFMKMPLFEMEHFIWLYICLILKPKKDIYMPFFNLNSFSHKSGYMTNNILIQNFKKKYIFVSYHYLMAHWYM